MAEEKAKEYIENLDPDAALVYRTNYLAHRPGISQKESTQVYDQWTTYDQDLSQKVYRGPKLAADEVADFFGKDREKVLVIDVACGTGFVGEELQRRGFKRLHGLDPSLSMLETARSKNVYQQDFLCYLDDRPLPINDDVYDCAVIAGGMGEGHIPTAGLHQLARIVKPGGLVCIVMREEYLDHVADYRGRLETAMKQMEDSGVWKMDSRTVVPRYSFDNNGVVFKFVVC